MKLKMKIVFFVYNKEIKCNIYYRNISYDFLI